MQLPDTYYGWVALVGDEGMKRIIAILMSLFLGCTFCIDTKASEIQPEHLKYINEIAKQYDICPELVESIIYYESRYDAKAVNKATGCTGLMQINPYVHKKRMKKLKVTDLKDARSNILVGCDYLYELFEEYEDVATVLMIYSEGNKGLKKAQKGKISKHVRLILEMSEQLEEEHNKCGGCG